MGHHNNNEQARFSVLVRRPAVVQAHIKLPTLGKHQSLSVSGGVRQAFHEASDFTLAGGVGWVWFSRAGLPVKAAGGWLGMGGWGMRLALLFA